MPRRLRLAVVTPSHSPIAEPFSGGQAAHVWSLATALTERGHDVTLYALPGTDPRLRTVELPVARLRLSDDATADVSMPADLAMREHHAYLTVMMELAASPGRYDVIHNQSLHYLPVAMSRFVATPMVTTLHTPPTPWLESAVQSTTRSHMRYTAVSDDTARRWRPLLGNVGVIANGVDLARWPAGPGGPDLVWTGRLVPEKAPHLAIRAARLTGRRLVLAGPAPDADYFRHEIEPLLGAGARYAGHLGQAELSRLVRTSAVAVVTPQWHEPYGLVVAEALASGTPVAGFRRGGVPEVVDERSARLITDESDAALAAAIEDAALLARADARRRAELACSHEAMVDRYELLFRDAVGAARPGALEPLDARPA